MTMSGNRLLISIFCILSLTACGYRPLYGTTSDSRGVVEALATISIPQADTRLGQLIRNDLLSAMRPAGTAGKDRYSLALTPVQSRSTFIDRSLPNTTRSSVKVTVDFQLNEGAQSVYSGKTFSQVSFDVVREPFADNQAEINATERAAHEISNDIKTRLAAYFASH
jgi:LPS-assembly lipoprotein